MKTIAVLRLLPPPCPEGPCDDDQVVHIPYISFFQVLDARGDNAGWNLNVLLSEFKATNALNDKLKGAEIIFNDSVLQYVPWIDKQSPSLSFDAKKLAIGQGVAPTPFMKANEEQGGVEQLMLSGEIIIRCEKVITMVLIQ